MVHTQKTKSSVALMKIWQLVFKEPNVVSLLLI